MMLASPVKAFFVRAVMHAKHNRIKELNELEAELIMAEERILNLQKKGISPQTLNSLSNRIDDLKKIIMNKKQEL